MQSDAMELELAKLGGRGAQSSRLREEKVREAARLHMKLGEVQRYCELMVELGEVRSGSNLIFKSSIT